MRIKLCPVRSDAHLTAVKQGDTLTINGTMLDFARLENGSTLPGAAVGSESVYGPVERIDGELIITLVMPHAADAPEPARFPADLANVPDGQVRLPTGLDPAPGVTTTGIIDWSQVVTAEMKADVAAADLLAQVHAETARRRATADAAIAPLQDAVDLDEATDDEAALLKEWKRYRVALNRLPDQAGYPNEIDWPAPPA